MKKVCIILSIVMIISFTIATVLGITEFQNITTFKETVNETKNVEFNESIEKIELDKIEVNTLNIFTTNEDTIYIELHGDYESAIYKDIILDVDNNYTNSINISMDRTKIFNYIYVNYYSNNITLDVYIPERYTGLLEINTLCENLNIDNINIDRTKIEGVVGEIKIDRFSGGLEINSVSSDIEITYVDFNDDLKINSVSSDIHVNIPKGSEYSVEQNTLPSSITYYIDDEKAERTIVNSRNKIEVNGLNSSLSINEYTKNMDI